MAEGSYPVVVDRSKSRKQGDTMPCLHEGMPQLIPLQAISDDLGGYSQAKVFSVLHIKRTINYLEVTGIWPCLSGKGGQSPGSLNCLRED